MLVLLSMYIVHCLACHRWQICELIQEFCSLFLVAGWIGGDFVSWKRGPRPVGCHGSRHVAAIPFYWRHQHGHSHPTCHIPAHSTRTEENRLVVLWTFMIMLICFLCTANSILSLCFTIPFCAIPGSVKKNPETNMMPLECSSLSRSAMVSVSGHQPSALKHFALKRKPKSAALRAEILQKCELLSLCLFGILFTHYSSFRFCQIS